MLPGQTSRNYHVMKRFPVLLAVVLLAGGPVGGHAGNVPEAPVVVPSDPSTVQPAIEAAARRGERKIVLPAGTYRFPARGDDRPALAFSGLRDLEIDATGAVLVFTDPARGSVRFDRCENVTLRGAVLLNEPIPFAQGRIGAIADDRGSFEVEVAKGYPALTGQREFIFDVFDPATRRWKPGTYDIFCTAVEPLAPGRFRVRQPLGKLAVGVGDLVGWRGPTPTDLELSHCAGMRVEDVVIRNGKGFCVAENGGEGGNYYRYRVTYGPTPPGAEEPPLMAANADAFHSAGVRRGPTLERCVFEGMGDDGVAIHGTFAAVVEASGTRMVIAARTGDFCLPGDGLTWMDEQQAAAGGAKVVGVRPLPAPPVPPVFPRDLRLFREPRDLRYFELTLDREISAVPGCLVGNPAACGGGFVVRDCEIRNHRARGMLLKADGGLVEGCTVADSTIAGIVVAPEMDYWNEAGYAHDLIVRGNVIRGVGGWTQPGLAMAGALSVGAYERGRYVPLPGGHRNILIEGNRFERNDGVNVLVSSAVGVTLRGNTFVHPMAAPSDRGHARGVEDGALIWLTECRDVHLEGNRTEEPGPFLRRPISPTATASGTGFTDGVSGR